MAFYEKTFNVNPYHQVAIFRLLLIYIDNDQRAKIVEVAIKGLQKNPNYQPCLKGLCHCFIEDGNYSEAIKHLMKLDNYQ